MAEHPEVVEQVIAESTDDEPASRRKVVNMIPKAGGPRRSSLPDSAKRAGWDFRKSVERLERIYADDRFPANREQVAAQLRGHLSYAIEVCQHLLDGLDQQPLED